MFMPSFQGRYIVGDWNWCDLRWNCVYGIHTEDMGILAAPDMISVLRKGEVITCRITCTQKGDCAFMDSDIHANLPKRYSTEMPHAIYEGRVDHLHDPVVVPIFSVIEFDL